MKTSNPTVGDCVTLTADAAELLELDTVRIFQITDVRGPGRDCQFTLACAGELLANPFEARRFRVFADDVRVVGR
jgi:hypothetical protein